MSEPVWISEALARALHAEQLVEHGGADGLRDSGLRASALARAPNLLACGAPDTCDLGAAYAFGIARNHAFVDGNKRAAFVVAATFIELNGRTMTASEADVVTTMLGVATGEIAEHQLADWFRGNSRAR